MMFAQQNNLCQKSVDTQIHALFCVIECTKKKNLIVKMFSIIKILKHVSRKQCSHLFVVSLALHVNLACLLAVKTWANGLVPPCLPFLSKIEIYF